MKDHLVDYETRLFRGSRMRSWLHCARFEWVLRQLEAIGEDSNDVFELGCFNGMLVEHIKPILGSYLGVDANWEGGLDLAKVRYSEEPNRRFEFVDAPEGLASIESKAFDFSVCLETIEHVPPAFVSGFLEQLARLTKSHVLITVPNELGPIFLGKYLGKRILGYAGESYSASEIFAATMGRLDRVSRDQHKGFDYRVLIKQMRLFFEIELVVGLPHTGMPPMLSFGVAILARPKHVVIKC